MYVCMYVCMYICPSALPPSLIIEYTMRNSRPHTMVGRDFIAASPLGAWAKEATPFQSGSRTISGTRYPRKATIATRPCFSSAAQNSRKRA